MAEIPRNWSRIAVGVLNPEPAAARLNPAIIDDGVVVDVVHSRPLMRSSPPALAMQNTIRVPFASAAV
jgi:hypothetical protein